jgi:Flp pilus assembly protein TadG
MRGTGKDGEGGRRAGHAVVEVALLAPWIFLLFAAVLDFGFYAYGLIATANAARVAALSTASDSYTAGDDQLACSLALAELAALPNARNLAPPCPTDAAGITNEFPVAVNAEAVTGADGFLASRVTVSYRTVPLIPLPWLAGRMTLTRSAEARVAED